MTIPFVLRRRFSIHQLLYGADASSFNVGHYDFVTQISPGFEATFSVIYLLLIFVSPECKH